MSRMQSQEMLVFIYICCSEMLDNSTCIDVFITYLFSKKHEQKINLMGFVYSAKLSTLDGMKTVTMEKKLK